MKLQLIEVTDIKKIIRSFLKTFYIYNIIKTSSEDVITLFASVSPHFLELR